MGETGRFPGMILPSRRTLLKAAAGMVGVAGPSAAYGRFVEPAGHLAVTRYRIAPRRWTPGLNLRLAVLADLHCGSPHMSLGRIAEIVEIANASEADAVVMLGDYVTRESRNVHGLAPGAWAPVLAKLRAPLGVHAIAGNHEYWDDPLVQSRREGVPVGVRALGDVGQPILQNEAVRLVKDGRPFWIAGLGDQLAFRLGGRRYHGLDDMPALLARITDDAPAVLLAHEPDIFAARHDRFSVTLSGHTHGGQVRLFGWSPIVPSNFGNRYAYGHVVEEERDLVVSAGLGTSGPAIRFGMPPEVVIVDLVG